MVRYKKRFFLVSFSPVSSSAFPDSKATIHIAVKNKIKELFGDYGLGVSSSQGGLKTIHWNPDIGVAIFQVRHEFREYLGASIPFLTELKGVKGVPRLLYTGATIRHCKMRLEKHLKKETFFI
eukprot:TRINITY_DN3569_c0_g1_i1.p1 TRINITY_DN3569_c0_g1~~TRINITY_DN3569_c0_g1_i1.p1  ORF type:complete len:123 (-),score=36.32 TRINITY_DN3569_c0_g1_i1:350-718(-)